MTRKEAIDMCMEVRHCLWIADEQKTTTIWDKGAVSEAMLMAIEALKADTVEVVRCKDCRHRIHDEERCLYYCEMYYGQGDVSDDNFCQWGAKMDGERNEE